MCGNLALPIDSCFHYDRVNPNETQKLGLPESDQLINYGVSVDRTDEQFGDAKE